MDFEKLYIDGQWIPGASGQFIEVENPATGEMFAKVPRGNAEDVDRAARAARRALPAWSALPLAERISLMEKFLTIFKSQEEDLIHITIKELGSPYAFTKASQVEYQYVRTRSYIDLSPKVPLVEKMEYSTTYREPVGVIGCITPLELSPGPGDPENRASPPHGKYGDFKAKPAHAPVVLLSGRGL